CRLRLQRHAEGVLRRPGIRDVEDVRRLAEDQRPLGGPRDRPEAVLTGGEWLPGDQHIPGNGEGGGLVGARTPHLAARNQFAERLAAPRSEERRVGKE